VARDDSALQRLVRGDEDAPAEVGEALVPVVKSILKI